LGWAAQLARLLLARPDQALRVCCASCLHLHVPRPRLLAVRSAAVDHADVPYNPRMRFLRLARFISEIERENSTITRLITEKTATISKIATSGPAVPAIKHTARYCSSERYASVSSPKLKVIKGRMQTKMPVHNLYTTFRHSVYRPIIIYSLRHKI
jgi:hypothetical protein